MWEYGVLRPNDVSQCMRLLTNIERKAPGIETQMRHIHNQQLFAVAMKKPANKTPRAMPAAVAKPAVCDVGGTLGQQRRPGGGRALRSTAPIAKDAAAAISKETEEKPVKQPIDSEGSGSDSEGSGDDERHEADPQVSQADNHAAHHSPPR